MTPEQEAEIRQLAAQLHAARKRLEAMQYTNVSGLTAEARVKLAEDTAIAYTNLMTYEFRLGAAQRRIANEAVKS